MEKEIKVQKQVQKMEKEIKEMEGVFEEEYLLRDRVRKRCSEGKIFCTMRRIEGCIRFYCSLCETRFLFFDDHCNEEKHKENFKCFENTMLNKARPWGFWDGKQFLNINSNCDVVIHDILYNDEMNDAKLDFLGVGLFSARVTDDWNVKKIWCAWNANDVIHGVEYHHLSVVTFSLTHNLGIWHTLDDELKDAKFENRRKDIVPLYPGIDKKTYEKMEVGFERVCSICNCRMSPGKDVATLMFGKPTKMLCSKKNSAGCFHVYHPSCLIYWLLRWEKATYRNRQRIVFIPMKQIELPSFCPRCYNDSPETMDSERERLQKEIAEWTKSPEASTSSVVGLAFPDETNDTCQLKMKMSRQVKFYRATTQSTFIPRLA